MKTKIYFLKGLQGSGKTTRAKEILKQDGLAVRVNKDDMRTQLFCSRWTPKLEKVVVRMERLIVEELLKSGHNVILDNTHLTSSHEEFYKNLASQNGSGFEVVFINTPIEQCIANDLKRKENGERYVGKDVILNTAWVSNIYRSPKTCVVFDMDGTLANISHRLPHVRNFNNDPNWKKDWGAFFRLVHNDVLREDIYQEYVKAKEEGHDIIIVSGRPDTVRKATEAWLLKHNIYPDRMIMRPASDNRDDTVIKQEIIDKYLDVPKIVRWYDDRPRVIRQVRTNGINVVDVGGGVEF